MRNSLDWKKKALKSKDKEIQELRQQLGMKTRTQSLAPVRQSASPSQNSSTTTHQNRKRDNTQHTKKQQQLQFKSTTLSRGTSSNTFSKFSHIKDLKLFRGWPVVVPGKYKLGSDAILVYQQKAVHASTEEFNAMWEEYSRIDPIINPFNRRPILRRQALYQVYKNGPREYRFSKQVTHSLGMVSNGPSIVKRCFQHANKWLSDNGLKQDCLITGLHCNWYPNGKAGVGFHEDEYYDCPIILSYALMDNETSKRSFQIRQKQGDKNIGDVKMGNGDLVVMQGKGFQKHFIHRVPQSTKQSLENVRRINITMRMWPKDQQIIIQKKHKKM